MKYKVKTIRGKHPRVEVFFEDNSYTPVGEMLLAERPFLNEIIKVLEGVIKNGNAESFSGNAFTVYTTHETTKITNDLSGEEAETGTGDLLKLTKAYQKQYGRIKR